MLLRAFWQSVCFSGTLTIDSVPLFFFGTGADWESDVPSLFLLSPVLATDSESVELASAVVFGAMTTGAKKAVEAGDYGVRFLGCRGYRLCFAVLPPVRELRRYIRRFAP